MSAPKLHTDAAIFAAVVEAGSARAASLVLGISTSHISLRMREYEVETGRRLPRPTKRLSAAGEASRIGNREIMAALRRIEAKLDDLSKRTSVSQWKPDHRRLSDGGTQVSEQRREVTGSRKRR